MTRSKPNAAEYSYRVIYSPEDEEFVGLCDEFPFMSHLDRNQVKAMEGIKSAVEFAIDLLLEDGNEVPLPMSQREYSGKFVVRVGPELHRELALGAQAEGMSLNTYVIKRLSQGRARQAG